jgi:branched-chain amino acid transport system permease protein
MGYAGQISLGHGAFFAIGGYTSAILTTRDLGTAGWVQRLQQIGLAAARDDLYGEPLVTFTPWAAFAMALLLAALAALLIGAPSLRLKGHYLAMATLGFGLIIYRVLLGSDFAGSADGITGVPPWALLPGVTISGRRAFRIENYYLACAFGLLVLVVLLNITQSRLGRALRSIHGGERAANAMGVNTAAYKLQAFVISAVLAAAAGCLLTHYSGGIGPSEAGALKSVRYVALVAAGGMANLWGAAVVSVVLTFLSLRGWFGTLDHAFFGVMLITIISLAPEGPLKPIYGQLRRLPAAFRNRTQRGP